MMDQLLWCMDCQIVYNMTHRTTAALRCIIIYEMLCITCASNMSFFWVGRVDPEKDALQTDMSKTDRGLSWEYVYGISVVTENSSSTFIINDMSRCHHITTYFHVLILYFFWLHESMNEIYM